MRTVDDLRFALGSKLACRPAIFFLLRRLQRRGLQNLVTNETGITIEGFPRSGTSFAVRAFHSANPEVRIAHHHHAAAQVLRSIRLGIPTLVVVRPPEEAVRSLIIRRPGLTTATALSAYRRFHECLVRSRDPIVVASFEEVTSNLGRVIDRVNALFGTVFQPFLHSQENVDAIFRAMERDNVAAYGRLLSTHIPRPDPERDRVKERIRLDGHPDHLARALDAYRRLLA